MLLDSLKREAAEESKAVIQDATKEDKQILDAVQNIIKKWK